MSGIAGIFNLDGRPVDKALLESMSEAIAHRGPDEEAFWLQGSVGLAHRQLRTTPESLNEHQPTPLDNGDYVITCDGRVDNREELIPALAAHAPVDAETSDAELLLRAYMAWGSDCVKRVIGDFAFVIWDARHRQLFCARDPMGIRTFFFFRDNNRFLFASDIRAILKAAGMPKVLNPLMVARYLTGKTNEAEQTFFTDIFQIGPAHSITVSREQFRKEIYWEPDPWHQIHYSTTEEYVEAFKEKFFEAVRCRLRSSAAVGMTLSGGMDSTSVTCTAAHLLENKLAPNIELHTFSSVFDDFPEVDERDYIQIILNTVAARAHYIQADELWGLKPLQKQGVFWNQPYPVPFAARHEALLDHARETGVRVMFTGEGADELLVPGFGYLLDLMKGLKIARLREELRYLVPASRHEFYKKATWGVVPEPIRKLYGRLRSVKTPRWVNPEFIKSSGVLEHIAATAPRRRSSSVHADSCYVGLVNLPKQPFLSYISEMYAHHHIVPRHPFFDLRLVDFLSRVPPHFLFSRGWSKLLLRQAMDGILPDTVRLRPQKSNFNDVLFQGIREEQRRIKRLIEDGYLVRSGWVNKQEINDIVTRVAAGNRVLYSRVIAFVTLEDWIAQYFTSSSV